METFLEKTAWPMTVPEPGSAFHLLFVLFGLAAALGLSRRAAVGLALVVVGTIVATVA